MVIRFKYTIIFTDSKRKFYLKKPKRYVLNSKSDSSRPARERERQKKTSRIKERKKYGAKEKCTGK
jgi:hypothetical protein